MNEQDSARVEASRRWPSPVWLIPLAAALIGAWLLYQNLAGRGPEITLEVDTAAGLQAGKTQVKVRSVDVGHVSSIRLANDYQGAIVTVRMNAGTGKLLVADSRFWVVKPRISRQGVSGLNTILSGAYIQLQPGDAKRHRDHFKVRDSAPVASTDKPGVTVALTSTQNNVLAVGDPILYQGQAVGHIESLHFSVARRRTRYRVFVRKPYAALITNETQFWLRSGIDFHVGTNGVDVQAGSLQSIIAGGVTFGLPKDMAAGQPAKDGATYQLYPSRNAAIQDRFDVKLEYVILLDDSVRGLADGAPVEYRGLRVGSVEKVPFYGKKYDLGQYSNFKIPVLIAIEPQRPANSFTDWNVLEWRRHIQRFFQDGMRATIKSSNLLTGAKFIDLSFDANASAYVAQRIGSYPVFPSETSSITSLQQTLSDLASKLNSLDLAPVASDLQHTLKASNATLDQLAKVTHNINDVLTDPATQHLPRELRGVLSDIRATLASYQRGAPAYAKFNRSLNRLNRVLDDVAPLARTLRDHPNALIFGGPGHTDPVPKAKH